MILEGHYIPLEIFVAMSFDHTMRYYINTYDLITSEIIQFVDNVTQ